MRLRFGVEDEVAFQSRCELPEDFAGWLQRQQPLGADAGDARVALDWKWGYAGGDLATWTVEDLDEFLLEWCPRKLSLPPEECSDFPASIGVFRTFLAARGLLRREQPTGDPVPALRAQYPRVRPQDLRTRRTSGRPRASSPPTRVRGGCSPSS